MKPETDQEERLVPALIAFLRARAWLIAALSVLVVVPCLWLPRIEAGDLGSHVYNAWLRQLVEQGQAPGLYFGPQWNNMFLDVGLDWVGRLVGLPAAEKFVLPVCVLIFFWGCFALVSVAAGKPAFYLTPAIAALGYGWSFHTGFINCYVSFGLAFAALAAFWRAKGWVRPWVALCGLLIVVAHPVGLAFFLCAAAYIASSEYLSGWKRIMLPALAVLTIEGLRLYFKFWGRAAFESDPPYILNGTDQLWLYSDRYGILSSVAFIGSAALLVFGAVRKWRAKESFAPLRIPLELYAIAIAGALLLPMSVRMGGSLAYIPQRCTCIAAAFGLCALACTNLKKLQFGFFASVAVVFFSFVYQDDGAINRMEARVKELVSGTPKGVRVTYTIPPPKDSRIPTFVHFVDRPCIGRCFEYENYEAGSREFKLRVSGPNRIVALGFPRCQMEGGHYVVQPGDLPMYQLYRPLEDPSTLQIRELHAGEENGRGGVQFTSPCMLAQRAFSKTPRRAGRSPND
jgi:hypothetical protein